MNKKFLALIATGAILTTTIAAAGCAAHKHAHKPAEHTTAVETVVAAETTEAEETTTEATETNIDLVEVKASAMVATEAPETETAATAAAKANANKAAKKKTAKKTAAKKTTKKTAKKTAKKTTAKKVVDLENDDYITKYFAGFTGRNIYFKINTMDHNNVKVEIKTKTGKTNRIYRMSGKFPIGADVLNYSNCQMWEYVKNPKTGKYEYKQVYKGGKGSITFLRAGIKWVDSKGGISKNYKLTRAE